MTADVTYLQQHRAHNLVYRAVRDGRLTRPDACEKCGVACKPDGAHHDYDRPLDVEWLCRKCHFVKDGLAGVPRPDRIKTHCRRGHEFTAENTARQRSGRYCRVCRKSQRLLAAKPHTIGA